MGIRGPTANIPPTPDSGDRLADLHARSTGAIKDARPRERPAA
jgi:hypothetical protein